MKKTCVLLTLTILSMLCGLPKAFAYLDPDTGEFITKDPAGFVDGPNVYTYVKQNPWTSFDPDGLSAGTIAWNIATRGFNAGEILNPIGAGLAFAYAAYSGYNDIQEYRHSLQEQNSQLEALRRHSEPLHQLIGGSVKHQQTSPVSPPDIEITPEANRQSTLINVPPQIEKPAESITVLPEKLPEIPGFGDTEPIFSPPEEVTPIQEKDIIFGAFKVHGNDRNSTKAQHVYIILAPDGQLVKVGISGQPLNENGESPRANSQIRNTNNVGVILDTIPAGIGARAAALAAEQQVVNEYAKENGGKGPDGNQRPQPNNQ